MSMIVGYLTVANMFCSTLMVNKSNMPLNKNDLVMAKKAVRLCEENITNGCLTQFVKYDNINYKYSCNEVKNEWDLRKFKRR